MAFKEIGIGDKSLLENYFFLNKSNSCQYSFPGVYIRKEKYCDQYLILENCLFIHRAGLENRTYRTYLVPMGGGDMSKAIKYLLADAHSHGKKMRLLCIKSFLPDLKAVANSDFTITENRDLFEYIYSTRDMILLSGKKTAAKRAAIRHFQDEYFGRYHIQPIRKSHCELICDFHGKWLNIHPEKIDCLSAGHETAALHRAFDNFEALGFSGVIMYIDNQMYGFAMGAKLSDNCYDYMFSKANTTARYIYQVMNQELVLHCCSDVDYINFEEDLGVAGLRKAKTSYNPKVVLGKYIITEN